MRRGKPACSKATCEDTCRVSVAQMSYGLCPAEGEAPLFTLHSPFPRMKHRLRA